MKLLLKTAAYILLIVMTEFISCKKVDQVTVPSTKQLIANAGIDQSITLPTDSVTLDGSASAGSIISYQWRKVSGPSSFSIQNTSAVKTVVKNLVQGVYQFELKVTDSKGVSSNAPVRVTVLPSPPINLQLIPFGTLSQARYSILAAAAGNKILFVGGNYFVPNCYYDSTDNTWYDCENTSTRVDIYDTSTHNWATVDLSGSRYSNWNNAVTVGNKIFFAGGYYDGSSDSSRVDIYDASSNSWSFINLPAVIRDVAVASLGNKIFFGGWNNGPGGGARVEIYDVSTSSWSTGSLSAGRIAIAATSVGNKILFAGGNNAAGYSSTVDIYDVSANNWSVNSLSSGRMHPRAITLNDKAFFAGGDAGNNNSYNPQVDIYNNSTQNWSTTTLPRGNYFFNAVASNNKALFFRGSNEISIYDDLTNLWMVGHLDKKIYNPGVVAVGNQIYVAGGNPDDGINHQTNQVWKLEF